MLEAYVVTGVLFALLYGVLIGAQRGVRGLNFTIVLLWMIAILLLWPVLLIAGVSVTIGTLFHKEPQSEEQ